MIRAPLVRTPWQEAVRLAWPATLSLLLHAAYRVTDQYWIQGLGPDAQAALGVTSFLHIFNFGFVTLLSTGTLARIAHGAGAGRPQQVRAAWHASWAFGLPWFALFGVLGWLATPMLVRACGASGEVERLAIAYIGVIYLVQPGIGMKPVVDAAYIGLGNTLVPMLLAVLSVGINFALTPALMFGWGPLPELGVAGAAWATGFSRAVGAALGMLGLARWYGLPVERRRLDRAEVRRMLAIGAPMAISAAGYALVFIAVLKTSVEALGRDVQAGLGVGFNGVEALSYCGLMGPAIAAASIVGRKLGAGDTEGARAGMRACLGMSLAISGVATLLFFLFPRQLAAAFSQDPAVLDEAALYLRVVAWTQLITGADAVLQQTMAGAGRTFRMSLVNLGCFALRIPLARWLGFTLAFGAAGVWWSLNVSNLLKLGAMILLIRRLNLFAPTRPAPAGTAAPDA